MTFQIRKAERKKAKLKLGVTGPSGSGKTYSSLLLAYGITGDWSKITLIDTENGSGELYANHGPIGEYNYLRLDAPFSPTRYNQAIDAAVKAGTEVLIIDSISHEWDGKGGCLDIHTELGGKFENWKKVTPMHQSFINAILQSPCHVVVTMRKKQDYDMTKGSDGKTKIQKVGLKEVQRDGFEYELTINFDIEINHYASASKDRTGVFMPKPTFKIDADTGRELLAWAESGATPKPVEIPKPMMTPTMNTKMSDNVDPPINPVFSHQATVGSEPSKKYSHQSWSQLQPNTAMQKTCGDNLNQSTEKTTTSGTTTRPLEELQQEARKLANAKGWGAKGFVQVAYEMFNKEPKELNETDLQALIAFHK